jgi:hypothetical protein
MSTAVKELLETPNPQFQNGSQGGSAQVPTIRTIDTSENRIFLHREAV